MSIQGRHTEAADLFRRASNLKPGFARAHAELGMSLARAGKKKEAVDALNSALRLDPDQVDVQRFLAEIVGPPP